MFKKPSKTNTLLKNTTQIRQTVNELSYIKDTLITVYNISTYNEELSMLIESIRYVDPSTKEEASQCHATITQLTEDFRRMVSKYSLDFNAYEFKKILKKIKLQVLERQRIQN